MTRPHRRRKPAGVEAPSPDRPVREDATRVAGVTGRSLPPTYPAHSPEEAAPASERPAWPPAAIRRGIPWEKPPGNIEGNFKNGPLRLLPGGGIAGPPAAPGVGGDGAGAAGAGGSSDEVLGGWPPIRGGGFKRSLATVLRLTIGMLGPFASSAPEPT